MGDSLLEAMKWKNLQNKNPQTKEAMNFLTGFVPGASDVQSGLMAAQDIKNQKYASALLNGLGMLPIIPALGGMIKKIDKIDEITGLPLNADGTVTLYHHTNKNAAEQIAKTGKLKSAGEPDVYLTTHKITDTGYGDTAVPIRIKPELLNIDYAFPNGRLDFRVNVGKPKGELPVIVEK